MSEFARAYPLPPPQSSPLPLLLAEDDADLRRMLELRLGISGFDVFSAADGAEALRLLESGDCPTPKVIITDWRMPGLDGLSLARAIRGGSACHEVPIILYTAHSPPSSIELNELGVDYLPKGTEWPDVQATLHTVMRRRRARARDGADTPAYGL